MSVDASDSRRKMGALGERQLAMSGRIFPFIIFNSSFHKTSSFTLTLAKV